MSQTEIDTLIPTLNKTGFMTQGLDPFSQAFVDFCSSQNSPVLEVGAAYGVATLPALQKGAKVFANDLDPRHLEILESKVPNQLKKNLVMLPGDFPEAILLKEDYFSAALACRVFHFFPGDKLDQALAALFKALKPEGKVFIVSETPYLGDYKDFIPLFEKRKKEGVRWPGIIEDTSVYAPKRLKDIPKFFNLLDPDTLQRALEEAGFRLERLETLSREDYTNDLRLDGRESVGAIASKP